MRFSDRRQSYCSVTIYTTTKMINTASRRTDLFGGKITTKKKTKT